MAKLMNSDLEFSQDDIDGLAKTLNDKVGGLPDKQRKLLLAIFTAAGDHVAVHNAAIVPGAAVVSPPPPPPATFGGEILRAFIPDGTNAFTDYCIQMRITPTPPGPGPDPAPPVPDPAPTGSDPAQ